VQLTLQQTQTTGLYRMPIEVMVATSAPAGRRAGGAPQSTSTIRTVQLTDTQQTFSWPSEAEPVNVVLDPSAWVVMRATLEKK
jgi:hypothetical protein